MLFAAGCFPRLLWLTVELTVQVSDTTKDAQRTTIDVKKK
jgi:hypothetical protein